MRDIEAVLISTQSQVRSYLAGMGVPPSEVDDIAQEVYIAYARESHAPPAGVEPVRWLKGIARNLAHDHFRRQARRGTTLCRLAEILEDAPAWLPRMADDEQTAALSRCLDRLNDEQRDLFQRYFGGGEEAGQLAASCDRTVDGLRRLMMKLRRALRECIERQQERAPA